MSLTLDAKHLSSGTRFLIFPQPRTLTAFRNPEIIWVSVPPARVQPGPADDRMYVVDPLNKMPYSQTYLPPYLDASNPPVPPGPDGHFTHLQPGTREFSCAAMYATVRRVLDIWEDYCGHRINWHFETNYDRLEMIPLIEWNNAQSGFGFLEFGYGSGPNGGLDHDQPYCQNFDVLAHELGHSILFAELGFPANEAAMTADFGGLHESTGDLVAIVSGMHFDTVIDYLLAKTHGNLFTVNELDRVGELSDSREVRIAFNNLRMSDVGQEAHDRSRPLTGAMFDVMVEVFQKKLVAGGLITQALADQSTQGPGPGRGQDLDAIQREFDLAYAGHEAAFATALLEARDVMGRLLALTWGRLNPNFLSYHEVLRRLMRADQDLFGGEHQQTIRECFAWREITVLPGSFLLRPHSLRECGLQPQPRAAAQAKAASGPELERLVRRLVEKELAARNGKPAAKSKSKRKRTTKDS